MGRSLLLAASLALIGSVAQAQYNDRNNSGSYNNYGTGSNPSSHSVSGYTNSNGTYVAPHQQTNPNSTQYDNYGTRGNVNPYSGAVGTRTPKW